MELLDIIASAHNGRGLESIGRQFGLDERQTRAAVEQLAPAVAAGVRRNAHSPEGMAELLRALQGGRHDRYLDEPDAVQFSNVAGDGNAILGHVFGSKDVSREVAMRAAGGTGIGGAILKQLLPIIASMVMGAITKKMTGGARRAPQPQSGGGGGLGDILGDVLGGGSQRRQPAPGGGLEDIFGDILGGGRRGGTAQRSPGGGGLTDILGEILGGGGRRGQYKAEKPDMSYDEEAFNKGRDALDDFLGRGSSGGNAADDLLNSVERRIGRR